MQLPVRAAPSSTSFGLAVSFVLAVVAGCKSQHEYVIPTASRQIFSQRCSVCHGMEWKGDGPAAGALAVKPRNYSDERWQDSVDDARLRTIIVEGGPSVGLSPLMVANPDLKDKPDVVEGLVGVVRGFRGR
jgi:mono/diheme cytochrome c family protein